MSSHASDPLMSEGHERVPNDTDEAAVDHNVVDETIIANRLVWLLTFSACISGLLFGYDTGIISATLVSIGSDLSARPLATLDKSIITAVTSLCALLASPFAASYSNSFGRIRAILLADVLFFMGAVIQFSSTTVSALVAGRAVVGLAVGVASCITPLYVAELAPAALRGRLVTLNVVFIASGQVTAYVIGWVLASPTGGEGWRIMVLAGGLPAIVQFIIMLTMPESPRWLVQTGRPKEARRVLSRLTDSKEGSSNTINHHIRLIEMGLERERSKKTARPEHSGQTSRQCLGDFKNTCRELLQTGSHRRALVIACSLQAVQQLCGFNSLMYFSATLFSLLGFSSPTLTALSVAITNVAFTMVSLVLIDRIGRRQLLLLSLPIMAIALTISAIAFTFIVLPSDTNSVNPSSSIDAHEKVPDLERSSSVIVLIGIMLYVAAYAVGIGNVPWQSSELFPSSIRSLGTSIATSTNWGTNFIVGISFLPMVDAVSPTLTFIIYAIVCVGGWILMWYIYPETKGLTLEQSSALLVDGWATH